MRRKVIFTTEQALQWFMLLVFLSSLTTACGQATLDGIVTFYRTPAASTMTQDERRGRVLYMQIAIPWNEFAESIARENDDLKQLSDSFRSDPPGLVHDPRVTRRQIELSEKCLAAHEHQTRLIREWTTVLKREAARSE
jgi:hypothetical protein